MRFSYGPSKNLFRRPWVVMKSERAIEADCTQCGPIRRVRVEVNILLGRTGRERLFCLTCGGRIQKPRRRKPKPK